MASHSRYIPALDGLRAFAVLAVVLYHISTTFLPSGLLGVTIFFVLSGYLITGLLIREWHDTKNINLPRFWIRRVRRLFPAIVFMILTVLILTALFAPDLLTKLRHDLVAALFWFTNWWYIFQDLSYFESMGAPSPVTHFWSLAIEEQFYLIWPPILLLLFKKGARKNVIQWGIVALAVISVVLMMVLYTPNADPSRVYYGTDTRAFSLLIGAWLAFVFPERRVRGKGSQALNQRQRQIIGYAGIVALTLIIVFMIFVNTYSPFLYYGGILIISLLTGVVILALVDPASQLTRIFSVAPVVYIGKISYGIYIWHYPLLLLMNDYNSTATTSPLMYILQICVIVGVAAFSYHFVEQPIRHGCLGGFWRQIKEKQATWQSIALKHIPQLGISAALLIGAIVSCIVVPETTTQQNVSMKESVVVPEGAFSGNSSSGSQSSSNSALSEDTEFDTFGGDTALSRDELISLLGPNPAIPALSTETLQQLANTTGNDSAQKAQNTQFILIGDSVTVALGNDGYGGFSETFPNAILDSAVNRNAVDGAQIYKSYEEQGWNGPVVIFELATNGTLTLESLNEMVETVPEGKMVFVVNARAHESVSSTNNRLLETVAANHNNVEIINWYLESANHDEYFDGDGTHLTANEGSTAYLNMLVRSLASLYQ